MKTSKIKVICYAKVGEHVLNVKDRTMHVQSQTGEWNDGLSIHTQIGTLPPFAYAMVLCMCVCERER